MNKIEIRNDVTVELVQHMGSDAMLAAAARVSTLAEMSKPDPERKDDKLLNFLMRNRHGTPFEHGAMTFFVQAPIFVSREWFRHRIGWSYNEESGRYRELRPVFYIAKQERPLIQEGKPGHYTFKPGSDHQYGALVKMHTRAFELAYDNYKALLQTGVAKEVARACLPVGLYSSWYATCNPRSLMHFLELRTRGVTATRPSSPQHEIELCAKNMEMHFASLFPLTYESWHSNGRMCP